MPVELRYDNRFKIECYMQMQKRLKKIPNKPTIYIDQGADITFLKTYELEIEIIQWKEYDKHGNKKAKKATPSKLIPEDNDRYIIDKSTEIISESTFTLNFKESEKFNLILEIVGRQNHKDVAHLDAAYINRAHVFLTSDKKDIYSKREKLEELLGFKIFLSTDNDQKISVENYIKKLINDIKN